MVPDLVRALIVGNPIVCLNLVKAAEKRPRETLLRSEFCNAVTYLNQGVCLLPTVRQHPVQRICELIEGARDIHSIDTIISLIQCG